MSTRKAISLKVGEAKTLTLRLGITGPDGTKTPVDVSATTMELVIADSADTPVITKADVDIDKTQGAAGIVTTELDTTDTTQTPGAEYAGELRIEFTVTNIDKTIDFDVEFVRSLTS